MFERLTLIQSIEYATSSCVTLNSLTEVYWSACSSTVHFRLVRIFFFKAYKFLNLIKFSLPLLNLFHLILEKLSAWSQSFALRRLFLRIWWWFYVILKLQSQLSLLSSLEIQLQLVKYIHATHKFIVEMWTLIVV